MPTQPATQPKQSPVQRPNTPAPGQMFLHRAYRSFSPIVKSKKTISYIAVTLSLFSLSFFGIFAIRPTLITAVSLMKNVADLKRLDLEYEDKISSVIRAQSEYEKIRDKIPLIHAALPQYSAFPVLTKALEDYSLRSGISISQLQIEGAPISKRPHTGAVQQFAFNLIGFGDYSSVITFVQHLTNWKRIVTIDSIELSQAGSTESGSLRMSLKGTTYYEP
jgi:Tfp pilus assembly protein PilO